jgi:hypothetical protein
MVAREAEAGHPAHNDFGADPGHAGGAAGYEEPGGGLGADESTRYEGRLRNGRGTEPPTVTRPRLRSRSNVAESGRCQRDVMTWDDDNHPDVEGQLVIVKIFIITETRVAS